MESSRCCVEVDPGVRVNQSSFIELALDLGRKRAQVWSRYRRVERYVGFREPRHVVVNERRHVPVHALVQVFAWPGHRNPKWRPTPVPFPPYPH